MLQQLYTVFFRRSNMRFAGYPTSAPLGVPLLPELSAGTVLSNVKITMRQQDTVAFYVLESYEIVPQEDRAA